MTLVQYLTAVTIGVGGGCVVFWIYQVGLYVLARRQAKIDARIRAGWAAEEAKRRKPLERMMVDLAAAHSAFWLKHGWRPTRMIVPSAKAMVLHEPWSMNSDITFKQRLENSLGVEIEFLAVESVQFDRWVQERAQ